MLCQDRPQLIFVLAAALILVWSFRIFVLDVPHAVATLLFSGEPKEDEFVRLAADVEFPAPIDYDPIREICARTEFRPGLVFSCEKQHGGIGMVRNQILKCVRYAINGGGSLVIPSMALRNASDISDIETDNEVPLDYLLDREAFRKHLTRGCPGMQVYEKAEDFPNYNKRSGEPLHLVGDQFEPDHPKEGLRHPRDWRRNFDSWLGAQAVQIRPEAPIHIMMEQSFLEYPVHDDGQPFVNEFGKILSFRNDTRMLAAKVLYQLKQRFALPIDPTKAINQNAYYGVHLRVEKDAVDAWQPDEWRFSRFDDQFEEQFQNLERTGLSVAYVASGDQAAVDVFSQRLAARLASSPGSRTRNVTVVTKHDLLQGADRQLLQSLTFDQHALVDFLMLFKASAFMGVAHSSFPWTVALRRHEVSRYPQYANEGSDLLRDEYSIIMGMAADYPYVDPFVTGIWP